MPLPSLLSRALGVLLGAVGSVPVAGPVSALVVHRGMAGRVREGAALALGASVMGASYCALALSGRELVVDRWPGAGQALQAWGAAIAVLVGGYLVFFVRLKCPLSGNEMDLGGGTWRHFALGSSLVALNPGVVVSWSVVVAMMHAAQLRIGGLAAQTAFVLGVGLGVLGWFGAVLLLFRHMRSHFPASVLQGVLRLLDAVLMIAGGFRLARVFA